MSLRESQQAMARIRRLEKEGCRLEKPINWDRPMLERFKVIITKANECKAHTIMFDDNEFVVDYALYLIKYLETKL